jgi:hypothetical protein
MFATQYSSRIRHLQLLPGSLPHAQAEEEPDVQRQIEEAAAAAASSSTGGTTATAR